MHKHAHTCRHSFVQGLPRRWAQGRPPCSLISLSCLWQLGDKCPLCVCWVCCVCVFVCVWWSLNEADSNEAEWEGWKHKVCAPVLACFCMCVSISHPAAYQSSPPCSSVWINLFSPSLTLGLIHASSRRGFWHSEGNVTAVTSETDAMPPTDIRRVSSLSAGVAERL